MLGFGALSWSQHIPLLTRWAAVATGGLVIASLVETDLLSINGYLVSTARLVRLASAIALVVAASWYHFTSDHAEQRGPDTHHHIDSLTPSDSGETVRWDHPSSDALHGEPDRQVVDGEC